MLQGLSLFLFLVFVLLVLIGGLRDRKKVYFFWFASFSTFTSSGAILRLNLNNHDTQHRIANQQTISNNCRPDCKCYLCISGTRSHTRIHAFALDVTPTLHPLWKWWWFGGGGRGGSSQTRPLVFRFLRCSVGAFRSSEQPITEGQASTARSPDQIGSQNVPNVTPPEQPLRPSCTFLIQSQNCMTS